MSKVEDSLAEKAKLRREKCKERSREDRKDPVVREHLNKMWYESHLKRISDPEKLAAYREYQRNYQREYRRRNAENK